MKPNLFQDRYLAAGMGLFAAYLALGRFAPAALGQFLSGALAGLSLLLIWVSILQNTRRGGPCWPGRAGSKPACWEGGHDHARLSVSLCRL